MFQWSNIFSRMVVLPYLIFVVFVSHVSNSEASDVPAPVANSGQTTSHVDGDNGALKQGLVWPDPRFTDNGDGTVTDNLTQLVWMQNANCWGNMPWSSALSNVAGLNTGSESCSEYNGSHTDWRLPNFKELESLIDAEKYNPALPSGHPFSGVQTNNYWSSTTVANNSSDAWFVYLNDGYVSYTGKTVSNYVWPVRGGQ